jgi:hypothetical protein
MARPKIRHTMRTNYETSRQKGRGKIHSVIRATGESAKFYLNYFIRTKKEAYKKNTPRATPRRKHA